MQRHFIVAALVMVGWAATPLVGQPAYPLAPISPRGLTVSPFMEGWYANPDGSYTISFGYFNRNEEQVVEIPLGPDNFIEPAEFDGLQPTSFPPRRERGVFTVTIPAELRGQDVVWTLRTRGQVHRVPGRVTSPAYELGFPMAMGSRPPALRFDPDGAVGRGPRGIFGPPLSVRVGAPLPLTIWAADDASERKAELGRLAREVPLGVTWFKHQGPGVVDFDEPAFRLEVGQQEARVTATFATAGDYILRVRVDNWLAVDSSPGDQCCWTNGYVRVTVAP